LQMITNTKYKLGTEVSQRPQTPGIDPQHLPFLRGKEFQDNRYSQGHSLFEPWQDSPNCNHQFKYAVTLKKRIVPVYAVESTKLHAGAIHMVTSPLIQARFGDIFAKCRVSLDFTSHSEWNNQISVLKEEIFAIINANANSVAGTTFAALTPIITDSSADYYSK
ncbi:hypothetical protein HDU84_000355, partial [Entophlyctis sp. JEL0112]